MYRANKVEQQLEKWIVLQRTSAAVADNLTTKSQIATAKNSNGLKCLSPLDDPCRAQSTEAGAGLGTAKRTQLVSANGRRFDQQEYEEKQSYGG